MSFTFQTNVDSIDEIDNHFVLGLSNLEGNLWDGTIKIVSSSTGQELLSRHTDSGNNDVKFFGENSEYILSARDDGKIYMYTSQDLEFQGYLAHHENIVSALSLRPSASSQFASCGWDGNIMVWDLQKGDIPLHLIRSGHYGPIYHADFNPHPSSTDHLLSTGDDGFVRLWDLREDPSRQGCSQLFALKQAGSYVHWDRAGKDTCFLVGCEDGSILEMDIREGRSRTSSALACSVMELGSSRPHRLRIRSLQTLSSRPQTLLSCSDDTTILATSRNPLKHNEDDYFQELYRLTSHKDYVTDFVWIPGDRDKSFPSIPQESEGAESEPAQKGEIHIGGLEQSNSDSVFSVSTDKTLRWTSLNF